MKKQFQTKKLGLWTSFQMLILFLFAGTGTSSAESLQIGTIYPIPGETFVSSEHPEGIEVTFNVESLTWSKAYFNFTTVSEVDYRNCSNTSVTPVFEDGTLKINFLNRLESARDYAKEGSEFNICIQGVKSGDMTLTEDDLPNSVKLDPETGDLYIYYKFDYVTSSPYKYPDPTGAVFSLPTAKTQYKYAESSNKNFIIPVATKGLLRTANTGVRDNCLFYDAELTQLVPCWSNNGSFGSVGTLRYEDLEIGHTYYYYGNYDLSSGTIIFYFDDGFTLGDVRPTDLPSKGSVDIIGSDELAFYPPSEGKLTINFTGQPAAEWFQVYENEQWVPAPYLGEYDSTSLTYKIEADGKYRLVVPEGEIKATLTTSFKEWEVLEIVSLTPTPDDVFPFGVSNEIYIKFYPNNLISCAVKIDYESEEGPVSIDGKDINIQLTLNQQLGKWYLNLVNLPNIFDEKLVSSNKYPGIKGDKFTVTLSNFKHWAAEVDELTGGYGNENLEVVLNYIYDRYAGMVKPIGEPNWPEYFTESGVYPAEPTVIEYESDIQFDGSQSIHVIGMLSIDPSGRDLPEGVDVPSFDLRNYSTISGNKLTIDFNGLKEEYQSLDGMMTISVINLLSGSKAVAPVLANVPFKSTKLPTFTLTYEIEDQAILSTDVQEGSKITVSFPENNDFKVVSVSFNGENQEVGETYTTPAIEENSVLNIVYEYARDINFDFTTGINSPEDCPYTISHEGENINIFGVKAGDNIKVYSLGGLKMADLGAVPSGKAVATFTLPTGNVYIVTINNKALKIKH